MHYSLSFKIPIEHRRCSRTGSLSIGAATSSQNTGNTTIIRKYDDSTKELANRIPKNGSFYEGARALKKRRSFYSRQENEAITSLFHLSRSQEVQHWNKESNAEEKPVLLSCE